jgi:hypothetical protein
MRKYGIPIAKQLMMTIPRIVLAVLIGITIARPLELKIFEKEINVKMAENRHKKILLNDSLLQLENNSQVMTAGQERSRLTERKVSVEDTLRRLQEAYLQEADGTGGSLHRGIEKLTRLKQDAFILALAQSKPEIDRLDKQIAYQDSLINNAKINMEDKRIRYEAAIQGDTGFLERNKALSDLSDQEPSIFLASLFISVLIILIETGPILSKLLMNVGPYDLALAKYELSQMAISENEMRRDKELLVEKIDGLYQKKREVSNELLEKFTALQKKHMADEIEKWERGDKSNSSKLPVNELMKKIKLQYDYAEENVL